MNELFTLMLSLAAGVALGVFYFGGLWLTLRQLPVSSQPVFLTVGSFFGRTAFSLFGFYLVIRGGRWELLVACLLGFMLAKLALVNSLRPRQRGKEPSAKEE